MVKDGDDYCAHGGRIRERASLARLIRSGQAALGAERLLFLRTKKREKTSLPGARDSSISIAGPRPGSTTMQRRHPLAALGPPLLLLLLVLGREASCQLSSVAVGRGGGGGRSGGARLRRARRFDAGGGGGNRRGGGRRSLSSVAGADGDGGGSLSMPGAAVGEDEARGDSRREGGAIEHIAALLEDASDLLSEEEEAGEGEDNVSEGDADRQSLVRPSRCVASLTKL